MKKEIIINSTEYDTRIAMLEDGRLVELLAEQPDAERMVGDIYIGKIQTVLPGMQAAFVDIGMEKADYLHSSDIGKTGRGHFESEDVDEEESPRTFWTKIAELRNRKTTKREVRVDFNSGSYIPALRVIRYHEMINYSPSHLREPNG